jgi:hypothetical protein
MNIRGNFQDFFFETALPALKARVWATYKQKQKMYNRLFRLETTDRSIEQFSQMAGTGALVQVPEGGATPTDDFVQGFDSTFRPLKYGLGIACSEELVADNKIGLVGRRAVALANSTVHTIESQAAAVFNNAFSTNGPDGVPLCSNAHPLVKAGGVQSNILAAAADLDVTSLELALTDWETTKTAEGFFQAMSTPRLLIAPANRWNAFEILKSQMRSDTANNTTNAFQMGGENGQAVSDILVWSYLTDPDAWFLVASPDETGLLWLWRRQPYTREDYDESRETGYLYKRYRATCGFHDWKGVYGTPGV